MERKFRASFIKAKEIVVRALEQERKCKIALILSWSFFCFGYVAQERAAQATERERKFRASSVKAKEIVVRDLEQERKCRIALILSWSFFFFFVLVMLFSCFVLSENVGMIRLSLPSGL